MTVEQGQAQEAVELTPEEQVQQTQKEEEEKAKDKAIVVENAQLKEAKKIVDAILQVQKEALEEGSRQLLHSAEVHEADLQEISRLQAIIATHAAERGLDAEKLEKASQMFAVQAVDLQEKDSLISEKEAARDNAMALCIATDKQRAASDQKASELEAENNYLKIEALNLAERIQAGELYTEEGELQNLINNILGRKGGANYEQPGQAEQAQG